MNEQKPALQTAGLRRPLPEALSEAARLGAGGVELLLDETFRPEQMGATALRDFRNKLERLNLRLAAATVRLGGGLDDPRQLDSRMQRMRAVMKAVYGMGARVAIFRLGRLPSALSEPAAEAMRTALADLARAGEHLGVRPTVRTGREAPEALRELLDRLAGAAPGVALDPGGLMLGGHWSDQVPETLRPWTVYVYATDAASDIEQGRARLVPLGQGTIDWTLLAARLAEQGYRGWYAIDCRDFERPVEQAGEAIRAFGRLFLG